MTLNSYCWIQKGDRVTLKILIEKCLCVIIKSWKESKILQVVINTINKGIVEFNRIKGRHSITVKLPKDIIIHKKNIGRTYCGFHNRLMGAR